GGAHVYDIGLALSPMAYFAQFELDVEGVAMVTASHNDNGWTGIKMGFARPLTFGPEEMAALKGLVLSGQGETAPGGSYVFVPDLADRYVRALTAGPSSRAGSKWLPPAAMARRARGRRVCSKALAARWCLSIVSSISIFRGTIPIRKT